MFKDVTLFQKELRAALKRVILTRFGTIRTSVIILCQKSYVMSKRESMSPY